MKTSPVPPASSAQPQSSESASYQRLVATGVAEEVRADVGRSAFPAHSPELLMSFERRARAQDAAATPPAIKPEESLADRWALEAIALSTEKVRQLEARVEERRLALEDTREVQAALPRPWSGALCLLVIALVLGGTILSTYQLGEFLSPSLDAFVLRGYLTTVYEDQAAGLSMNDARWLAWGAAGSLLLWQSLTALITWGRLSSTNKAMFFLADALFAGAFALVRLGSEATGPSLSLSVFELSLVVLFSSALSGVSRAFSQDAEVRRPYRLAEAATERAEESYKAALNDLEQRTRDLAGLKAQLARREDAVRRHGACQELMAATATTEYLVTLSELISESAASRSANQLLAQLPDEVHRVFAPRQ